MAASDAVAAALARLNTDRTDLDTAYGIKAAKDALAAQALNEQSVANNALASGVANFEADKAAAIQLIQDTYTSGPPT